MEMNGGSSAPYLAAPLAFPCFVPCLIGVETEGFLDYQGRAGSFPLYGGTFVRSYSVPNGRPRFWVMGVRISECLFFHGLEGLLEVLDQGCPHE